MGHNPIGNIALRMLKSKRLYKKCKKNNDDGNNNIKK